MICGRRGDEGALVFAGSGRVRPDDECQNRFFLAMLSARPRALVAAREATLEGDDESGGGTACGGGGKVMLFPLEGEALL
jgi:hypothetical protein